MILEQIEAMWAIDAKIDPLNISHSSAVTYELHSKYFKFLNAAKRELSRIEGEKSRMTVLKAEYYWGDADQQTLKDYGWKQFAKKLGSKTDLPAYIQGDRDIIAFNIKISDLKTIIDFLESIIRAIHSRSFVITNIIEDRKFLNGGH